MLTPLKLSILGLALFSVISTTVRADDEETTQTAAAQHFISLLSDGKFKDAEDQSDAAMQQALPADKLHAIWQMLTQTNGVLKQQRVGHVQMVKGYQVIDVVCQFDQAELIVRLSLDQNQRVAGLFILPKENPNDLSLKTKTGTLYGTIDLPAGKGPWPVALVLAGSGPVDRDGNEPGLKNDCLKMLGQDLAAHDIAVLRVDKRGIGQSAAALAREVDLRFDDYVDDAAQWIALLRKDPRFTSVAIVGHSEGSLIGMLAAQRADIDAFVSLAGAGRSIADLLREQLQRNLSSEMYHTSEHIINELVAGRKVDEVPAELQALFRPSIQPYDISQFKCDPAIEIAKLTVPVLIVQGTTDIQVSEKDAKLLAEANKKARLVIVPSMNHMLKHSPVTWGWVQGITYSNPAFPLEPKLTDALVSFLHESLPAKKN